MAASQDAFKDVHPLPHPPENPNSVRWADDGTLAVSTGNCITLLHPGRLNAARALATPDSERLNSVTSAIGDPGPTASNIHFDFAYANRVLVTAHKERQSIVSMAWSPVGCSVTGTCLLAAVTEDHQVYVYGPSATSLSTEWPCHASPMDDLLKRLDQTAWAEVETGGAVGQSQQPEGDALQGALRLRGGAKGSSKSKQRVPSSEDDDEEEEEEERKIEKERKPAAKPRGASGSSDPPQAHKGGNRRKPAAPQQAPTGDATDAAAAAAGRRGSSKDPPPPEVDFSPERQPKIAVAIAAIQHFFALRRMLPEEDIPEYEASNSHLKGADVELLERATARLWGLHARVLEESKLNLASFAKECRLHLRYAWDRKNNVIKVGFEALGAPGGTPAAAAEAGENVEGAEEMQENEARDTGARTRRQRRRTTGDGDEAAVKDEPQEHDTRDKQTGTKSAAPPPTWEPLPPFEVPDDFHWRDLPPVDPANRSTLRRTLINGAVRRFFMLRAEEPVEAFHAYEATGSHLRGIDAWLVERVNKEYSTAHAPALEALAYTSKSFAQNWATRMRQVWDRVTGQFIGDFTLENEPELEHSDGSDPPVPISNIELPKRTSTKRPATAITASDEDGDEEGDVVEFGRLPKRTRPRAKKSTGAATTAGGRVIGSSGGVLSSEAYQRRLLAVSALSVSWSPIVPGPGESRCCYLAVGMKDGRVWLWRYTLPPPQAPSNTHDISIDEHSPVKDRLVLLDNLPGNFSWASVMAWVGLPEATSTSPSSSTAAPCTSLALAVGASDGGVSLWAASAATLAALQPGTPFQSSMKKLPAPVLPDLRPVTSLDACLRHPTDATAGSQLVLAVGKTMGQVVVWISKPLGCKMEHSDRVFEPLENGLVAVPPQTEMGSSLGTHTVTGIACVAGGELVVACCRDGAMATYALPDTLASRNGGSTQLELSACAPPVPCSRRRSKDNGFGAFGVAASPGRLFLAVVRLSLPYGIHFVKQLQIHQQVTQGLVQVYRLAGPGAAVTDALTAAGVCCQAWVAGKLPPAALWDAVQLAAMSRQWLGDEALAEGCKSLADTLESTFSAAKQGAQLPLDIRPEAWRSLQAAATLRRAAAPAAADTAAWKAALDANETLLLQRQLQHLLQGNGMSRLLAADCVVANVDHPHLLEGMVSLASRAYHESGESPPSEATGFAVPWRPISELGKGVTAVVRGGGGASALSATLKTEGESVQTELPRCPATLEACVQGLMWACRLCGRAYKCPPEEGSAGEVQCVMCAGLVGLSRPDFLIYPPCM